jgi:hypothetical protein
LISGQLDGLGQDPAPLVAELQELFEVAAGASPGPGV